MALIDVQVPDIGDFDEVAVIELTPYRNPSRCRTGKSIHGCIVENRLSRSSL